MRRKTVVKLRAEKKKQRERGDSVVLPKLEYVIHLESGQNTDCDSGPWGGA